MKQLFIKAGILTLILLYSTSAIADVYTRGVGVYPGDIDETFAPKMTIDSRTYRNIALRKPAYHSSSMDYNLTAQLINDGIIETEIPAWITCKTSAGPLTKTERAKLIDRHVSTSISIDSSYAWVEISAEGNGYIPQIDSVFVSGSLFVNEEDPQGWKYEILGSNDGRNWTQLAQSEGDTLPGLPQTGFWRYFSPKNFRNFTQHFNINTSEIYSHYRLVLNSPNATHWDFTDMLTYYQGEWIPIGGAYLFNSSWMSAGTGTEWIMIDLGAECSFDKIVLNWIKRANEGIIQVSDDRNNWSTLAVIKKSSQLKDMFSLKEKKSGRYIRILMTEAESNIGYILSEVEVYGQDAYVAQPHPVKTPTNTHIDLAGGNWKLQRENFVNADGMTLSSQNYDDSDWIVATVPATVLMSYVNAGMVSDPNYADNQVMISESFFYSDFWYRNVFEVPADYKGKRITLNFDGINWKAQVYLNGKKVGRVEGAFTRGQFDVTDLIKSDGKNILAVRIEKNKTPGMVKEQTKLSPDANGGAIGADNPTFHASIGWDWIPTIRGRNIGIWNDAFLTASGPVTIKDPFIQTDLPLPDTTTANIHIETILVNRTNESVSGILYAQYGDIIVKEDVLLNGLESKIVIMDAESHPQLNLKEPKLWWPNGYGAPNLYDVKLKFITSDDLISDQHTFKSGIREMTYNEDDGNLKIWINGRRFIGFGGNWGFPESNLCYRNREYDIAVRYHKDMHFTMIRNWVGMTGDEEFYEACDRYGVMVWQDFWLANPVDGPNPEDESMFIANVDDFVKKIRNHPSIGLYCGRNEGNPPKSLDDSIRSALPKLHPDVHYISNSAFGVVSGGGPYRAMPIEFYFKKRAIPKFHSEIGMPNIVSYESMQQMMPDSCIWPHGRMWGLHDFCLNGAQGASSYFEEMEKNFGKLDNVKDWLTMAQWINYQGYRAMFEAQSKYRMGLLLWMSHPAWPSFVWQTYDYYFEPTAAYFGCKKACEPLHVQWNALTNQVEVVNYHSRQGTGLTVIAELLNLDGSIQWKKEMSLNCDEDSTVQCFTVETPESLSPVYFLRLKLKQGKSLVSENIYWAGVEKGNYKAVMDLPKIALKTRTKVKHDKEYWTIRTQIINPSKSVVPMIKAKVIGKQMNKRILPALFDDNYITLMPGESKTINIKLKHEDTQGDKPTVVLEGLNVK